MERLTQKESAFIELLASGELNQTDACMQVFDCKNKKSAGVVATNLLKKEKVKAALAKRQEDIQNKLTEKMIDNRMNFSEMVDKFVGGRPAIARRLAQVLKTGGQREFNKALELYLRTSGDLAPSKVLGVFYKNKANEMLGEISDSNEKMIEQRVIENNIEQSE